MPGPNTDAGRIGLIIHWALKSKKVPTSEARLYGFELDLALEGKVSAEPTDELHFLGQSPVVWFLKVQFLKSGCSIHWFLKYEKVPRAKLRLYGFSWFFMFFHAPHPTQKGLP